MGIFLRVNWHKLTVRRNQFLNRAWRKPALPSNVLFASKIIHVILLVTYRLVVTS
jgi:hypothetical protein